MDVFGRQSPPNLAASGGVSSVFPERGPQYPLRQRFQASICSGDGGSQDGHHRGTGLLCYMSVGFRDGGSSVGDALQSSLPCGVSKEMAGAELFVPSLLLFASSRTILVNSLKNMLSMMSAIMMEIYSISFVPNTSLGVSCLQIWLPPEEFALFSQSEDRNNTHFDRGSRPASAAAVEGLKMVTAEELDS
ncbi:hypothetical protein ZIOFF_007718 [Zingiber officinale]|uniref:Uncharacterized protein n=1 Tax=Zingiber officinale TaxID=94328 RepID=A0A8J5I2C0_ZINOF|nr:hypothetical protein ZIOFF_007718 [Zingiber officinale]